MSLNLHLERLDLIVISAESTLNNALPSMDKAGYGIILLVDDVGKLVGVITDGNIRRGILNNESFDQSCSNFASSNPLTCDPDITAAEALELMNHGRPWKLSHLPVVVDGRPVGLILRADLMEMDELPLKAVIMAGGFGTRMQPHTLDMPKPMLPVGGKPMLEHIVGQLRDSGVKHMQITTHYKAEMIKDHFGDGSSHGVKVDYVNEDCPLGTAGALGLLKLQQAPLLVMNGDIVTKLDFRKMLDFHKEHKAEMTVAVRQYEMSVPFGVVETQGVNITKITEKPATAFLVNAGIYLLEPNIIKSIPVEQRMDMTDLIDLLLTEDRRVVSFPVVEYWLDVGTPLDYGLANEEASYMP